MKRLMTIAICSVFLTTPVFADMVIRLFDTSVGHGDVFGPYRATVEAGTDPIGIYKAGDAFDTFCMESDEHFNWGRPYYVTLNTGAVNGGPGYAGTSDFDPLDPQTAGIYNYWLDHANQTPALAQDVSEAIWWQEQESLGVKNNLNTMNFSNTSNVMVMNLWTTKNSDGTYSGPAQDQLVTVPVPGAGRPPFPAQTGSPPRAVTVATG